MLSMACQALRGYQLVLPGALAHVHDALSFAESLAREAPLAGVEFWLMGELCVALVTPFELMPVGVVLSPPCWLVVTLALMPRVLRNSRLRMAVAKLPWLMEPVWSRRC